MRRLVFLLLAAAACISAENTLSKEDSDKGWVLLFDGETLDGWTQEGTAHWKVAGGAILGEGDGYGWLRHNTPFRNFRLHCEFRTGADGNSGIFLRASSAGLPHLTGYELQICDKHPRYPTGSLVGYAAAKGGAIKPDEWQSFDVLAYRGHFLVKLDGQKVLETIDGKSFSGYIGLQFNKDKKIEFRNIRVRPLPERPLLP